MKEITRFALSEITGFDREIGIFRLDASRILLINGMYHMWYTRFEQRDTVNEIVTSKYLSSIWLATSADGRSWTEVGDVMEHPGSEIWPACFRHAPYVIEASGKYYMFFTAQAGSTYMDKWIGLAVADRPEGPFAYLGDGPLCSDRNEPADHDPIGQDDSCVLFRDGKYHLYHKNYGYDPIKKAAVNHRICLAVSENVEGPYEYVSADPVAESHTGCAWPQGEGVALLSDVGPVSLHYSADGVRFRKLSDITVTLNDSSLQEDVDASNRLWHAPMCDSGVYVDSEGVSWGIAQVPDVENAPKGGAQPNWYPFFVRFDVDESGDGRG